jgi:hypothetical protein
MGLHPRLLLAAISLACLYHGTEIDGLGHCTGWVKRLELKTGCPGMVPKEMEHKLPYIYVNTSTDHVRVGG